MDANRLERGQIGRASQAAFSHKRPARRHGEFERCLKIDIQSLEISVIDPKQRRFQQQRPIAFGGVMDFDQHIEVVRHGDRFELGGLGIRQCRHDQQHGIGTDGAGLDDLPGVDDEILADDRQCAGGARSDEIGVAPKKPAVLGQYRQAGGTAGLIGGGKCCGFEIGADQAFGGAGFFHFGNQRGAAVRMGGMDGGDEAAHRIGGGGGGFEIGKAVRGTGGGDQAALVVADHCQGIGHRKALQRARVSAAAPEASASRAERAAMGIASSRATVSAAAALSTTIS